jgi:hypothetical protein
MKQHLMRMVAGGLTMLGVAGAFAAEERRIFNGKDMEGWAGAPGWWTVEDGALTAQSTPEKPCTQSNYLIWKGGEPADFELTVDFRLSGSANSGVQVRSEALPNWDVAGYQADMTGSGDITGFIYHPRRHLIGGRGESVTIAENGQVTKERFAADAELVKVIKKDDWNSCRIVCRGPVIEYHVNGVLMSRVTDHDPSTARPKGIIALQMHSGPPMKIQFKNIVLKEFK